MRKRWTSSFVAAGIVTTVLLSGAVVGSCGAGTAAIVATVGDQVHVDNPFSDESSDCSNLLTVGQFHDAQAPGSLLLFPYLALPAGGTTYLTLTNTDTAGPSVQVELVFISSGAVGPCGGLAPLTFRLQPNDTQTAVVNALEPGMTVSFAWAFAKDEQGRAMSFNHLVGAFLAIDVNNAVALGTNAVAFQSPRPQGQTTDLDADGLRDLNGKEYSPLPATFLFPRFMSQEPTAGFSSSIVILSLAGPGFTTIVDASIINDNSDVQSSQFSFDCHVELPLTNISNAFTQAALAGLPTNDPNEIIGEPTRESGWFRLRSNLAVLGGTTITSPGIYAFLIERANATSQPAAVHVPFHQGSLTTAQLPF